MQGVLRIVKLDITFYLANNAWNVCKIVQFAKTTRNPRQST